MSKKTRLILTACAVIALLGAGWWTVQRFGWFAADPLANGPIVLQPGAVSQHREPVPYKVEQVVTGLVVPWSMVFTSENRYLVSERSGDIRVVEDGKLRETPFTTFSDVAEIGEAGLLGLALDPDYASSKRVYACYTHATDRGYANKVIRFEDSDAGAGQPEVLIDNMPAAGVHSGCRLSFGPDEKLYVTVGDAGNKNLAQDEQALNGKILRINKDGSVPEDNPYPDSPIWSLGHRNPQGLAWQPSTNQLYETEHGPSGNDGPAGGDEINSIGKGSNYGWPEVSHEKTDDRFVSPLLVFTPAVAPSGATFYTGDVFPQFQNDLLFAALRGEGIIRVHFDVGNPSEVAMYERLSDVSVGRVRDIIQGPDGYIYFLTSNRDGRGTPRDGDDSVYRLIPAN